MEGKTIAKEETSKGKVLLYDYANPYGPFMYAVRDASGKVYYFKLEEFKAACDKFKELVAALG